MRLPAIGLALLSPISVFAQTRIGSLSAPVGGNLGGQAVIGRGPRVNVMASPLIFSVPALALPKPIAKPVVAAAPAVASIAQLQVMTAELAGPKKGSSPEGDGIGKKFDGAKARQEGSDVDADIPTQDIAQAPEELKELWFGGKAKKKVAASEQTVSINFIRGSGSEWYWNKFKKNDSVRVVSGGRFLFMTKIGKSEIKTIKTLNKSDFAGFYDVRTIRANDVAKLRKRLISELTAKESVKSGKIATLNSQVSVVRFMSYKEARVLPENIEEPVLETGPRAPAAIPAALASLELHKYLPKAVVLDMRLFPQTAPFGFIDDMGKLMKSGVYFILVTDKKSEGPGSLEEVLTKGLTNKQRDLISRYKMIAVTDDGNRISKFNGSFAAPLPSRRFTNAELELMEFAAFKQGGVKVSAKRGDGMTLELAKGTDAEAFGRGFSSMLGKLSGTAPIKYSVKVQGTTLTLQPTSLDESIPHVMEVLRDHEGLFVNPSDLMVISRDAKLLKAFQGSLQPSAHAEGQDGPALVDSSLAALLGDYRENKSGDLAASASKISSFLYNKNSGPGGSRYSVPMMMGHVMHSAFNWAAWTYRNTGVFPDADAVAARAARNWDTEVAEKGASLAGEPNTTMAGYHEAMLSRMRSMHGPVADLLKQYPIMVGTELPNLVVVDRFKKSTPVGRDVLRLVYDMVLARETPDGLEVIIVDFKTGQTPTIQNLEKDTQVQLYDEVVRNVWKSLPLPYGGAGQFQKVAKTGVAFVYNTGTYQPTLNEWGRIKFEKFLKNVMNRIRKHNNPPAPKEKKKK